MYFRAVGCFWCVKKSSPYVVSSLLCVPMQFSSFNFSERCFSVSFSSDTGHGLKLRKRKEGGPSKKGLTEREKEREAIEPTTPVCLYSFQRKEKGEKKKAHCQEEGDHKRRKRKGERGRRRRRQESSTFRVVLNAQDSNSTFLLLLSLPRNNKRL